MAPGHHAARRVIGRVQCFGDLCDLVGLLRCSVKGHVLVFFQAAQIVLNPAPNRRGDVIQVAAFLRNHIGVSGLLPGQVIGGAGPGCLSDQARRIGRHHLLDESTHAAGISILVVMGCRLLLARIPFPLSFIGFRHREKAPFGIIRRKLCDNGTGACLLVIRLFNSLTQLTQRVIGH